MLGTIFDWGEGGRRRLAKQAAATIHRRSEEVPTVPLTGEAMKQSVSFGQNPPAPLGPPGCEEYCAVMTVCCLPGLCSCCFPALQSARLAVGNLFT